MIMQDNAASNYRK